jgi:hypothetical protein
MSPIEALATARYADVWMMVHGAAVGFHFLMNNVGANAFCRTTIELMVWGRDAVSNAYLRDSSKRVNSAFERVRAKNVTYSTAAMSEGEKERRSRSADFVSQQMWFGYSFENEYDDNDVRAALQLSLARWGRCKS